MKNMNNLKLKLYSYLLNFFLKKKNFKMVNFFLEKKKKLAIEIRKNI